MPHYTLLITSCNRFDLLKQTLDSFIAVGCGGLKPRETIIVDDSNEPQPAWFTENWPYYSANLGTVTWVSNGARMGQIYSADRLWSMCKTEYAVWLEDDWQFNEGHFMPDSFAILEKYPNIIQVSWRGNTGWHQLIDAPPFEGFKIAMPYWKGGWGGHSFNCAARRKSDWQRIGSYGKHVTYGTLGLGHEITLSKLYLERGYRIADLNRPIVAHTGGTRSRMHDDPIPLPKILIAIPVCHAFEYGKWESGDSPRFDAAIAYNGEAYGQGIHISGENNRIETLRATWLKDVAKFSAHVDYKLFYGAPHNREPLADEVFLSCADDYAHLPHKTIAICKWAKEHGYDWVFKADDDSLVYVDRLVRELMTNRFDYAGYLNGKMCSGGPGYWLSKRAIGIIAEHASANQHWAEDVTVGKTLFHHNIQPFMLPEHHPGFSDHWIWPDGKFDATKIPADTVTMHAVQPEVMRQWYAAKETK
jgi:hypothetical protein